MKLLNRIFFLGFAAIAMWGWAGCGGGGCPTTSFGSSAVLGATARTSTTPRGCSSTGGGGGGGGSTAAFLYYVGSSDILGASLSTTGTFAALNPFTPPTLPSSAGNDMI